jgi:outer membrane protein OmpA-like peptidoglycan-associated protein
MKWHVIHTKVREEFRALENLQAQGFEVFFANGTTFAPNQVETLQKVATLLKNNPNYTVVINGNAYKGGSKALSLQRAEKVAGTLRMKGVNVSNAKTEGFGDTRAKYNNTKDNRAEIEVYSFE